VSEAGDRCRNPERQRSRRIFIILVPRGGLEPKAIFTGVTQFTLRRTSLAGLSSGIFLIYPDPAKLNDPEMAIKRIS
jgi:hypothetical protein